MKERGQGWTPRLKVNQPTGLKKPDWGRGAEHGYWSRQTGRQNLQRLWELCVDKCHTEKKRNVFFSLSPHNLRHTALGSFPLPQQIPAINQQLKRKVWFDHGFISSSPWLVGPFLWACSKAASTPRWLQVAEHSHLPYNQKLKTEKMSGPRSHTPLQVHAPSDLCPQRPLDLTQFRFLKVPSPPSSATLGSSSLADGFLGGT